MTGPAGQLEGVWQLHDAAEAGDLEQVLACLASGTDPNAPRTLWGVLAEGPLHAACANGHASCAAALLAAGANLDANSGGYRQPLHGAAARGQAVCVQILLEAGADPRARTITGATPLSEAATNGDSACVAALLAGGADPTAADNAGWTAAHDAAFNGRVAPLRLLLAAEPGLASVTGAARLPLAYALGTDQLAAARCLLEQGALPPPCQVLALLGNHQPGASVHPLYAVLAARAPLAPNEWQLVPHPCRGMGAALPAVLSRSTREAAALVSRLEPTERLRLRTAALSLTRAQRVQGVQLPAPILGRVLALAMAGTHPPPDE